MKTGLDDFFARGMGTRADLETMVVDKLPPRGDEWEEPVPLDDPVGPPFPGDALPGDLGRFVRSIANETQTDPGLAGCVALGVLSAATRGRYEVQVPGTSWVEPVIAQLMPVAGSGERKTAVLERLVAPALEWERERNREDDAEIKQWESQRRVLQKQLDAAEAEASKDMTPDLVVLREAAVLELAEHDARQRHRIRILVDDVTPEKAKQILCEQGGALAVISDEGTFIATTLANRYGNNGPGQSAIDVALTGHAGTKITVDRKSGPALFTPRSALTLAIACQPHVVESLGEIGGFRERGGAARIWPAFLASTVGSRSFDAPPVPPILAEVWRITIRDILEHNPRRDVDGGGYPYRARIELDAPATDLLRSHWPRWEVELVSNGRFGGDPHLRAWGSKLPGAVLRIAGLLHIATNSVPEDHPIEVDTLRQAIAIGEYFAEHAAIFHRVMAGGGGQADARAALSALEALAVELGYPVTRRELHQKLRGRTVFRSPDSLSKPLAMLEEFGWIRRSRKPLGPHGGRPSELIALTPYSNAQNTQNPLDSDNRVGFEGFENMSMINPSQPSDIDLSRERHPLSPTGTVVEWIEIEP